MNNMIEAARKRASFYKSIRNFFDEHGYLEVETPLLSPFLIPEPSIEIFATFYLAPDGVKKSFFLAPSPELWMKRLISRGFPKIFQINKCFRNFESTSRIHNPEFSMLEWYTLDSGYVEEIPVIENLIRYLCESLKITPGFRLDSQFMRISMKDAFDEYAGLDLDALFAPEALSEAALQKGIQASQYDTEEVLFNKIFLTLVEPSLPREKPVIVLDYPACIPTLASKKEGGLYYERWELYINGREIANCYSEETNQKLISGFIKEESSRKQKAHIRHDIDKGFPGIFHPQYPSCAGTALGLDRLFMCLYGGDSIDETLLFPFSGMFHRY